jgi:hypothetical protein
MIEFISTYLLIILIIIDLQVLFFAVNLAWNYFTRIDNVRLENMARNAGLYEIAYIKGQETEVMKLCILNLIKSNVLIPGTKEYIINPEFSDFDILNDIELDLYSFLKDYPSRYFDVVHYHKKQLEKYLTRAEEKFDKYRQKIDELKLRNILLPLYERFNVIMLTLLLISPLIFAFLWAMHLTKFKDCFMGTCSMYIINLLFFALITRLGYTFIEDLTSSGKKYIEYFEKHNFPYPEVSLNYDKYNTMFIVPEPCRGI